MDFSAWTVDVKSRSATHESGFRLEVEGNPRNPSAVHPGKFPPGCSSLDQVRLVRTGVEAIAKAATASQEAPAKKPRPVRKSGGNRPTLSLKKTSPKHEED